MAALPITISYSWTTGSSPLTLNGTAAVPPPLADKGNDVPGYSAYWSLAASGSNAGSAAPSLPAPTSPAVDLNSVLKLTLGGAAGSSASVPMVVCNSWTKGEGGKGKKTTYYYSLGVIYHAEFDVQMPASCQPGAPSCGSSVARFSLEGLRPPASSRVAHPSAAQATQARPAARRR